MLRTVLAGVKARPLRLLLSAVAIALGVAFVAGSFVLSDAVGAGLRAAVATDTRGVDVSISSTKQPLDDRLLDKVRQVPGVAAADGRMTVSAPIRDTAGHPKDSAATALTSDERLRPYDLADGRFPSSASEIAMAEDSVDRPLGQPVTVFDANGGSHVFTLVGTFRRPTDAGIGASPMLLQPEALQQLAPGKEYGRIVVRAQPGVGVEGLITDLERAIGGRGVEVVTGHAAARLLLAQAAPDSAMLAKFFTMFAVLAMVVAAMVITNSFTILVTQRARESALLRCVGAAKRQVFTGVLAEAAVVGAVASAVGLAGGFGVAAALQSIAAPESPVYLPVTARTVVAALSLGVLVTVLAAAIPAWSATRVPPIEALRTPVEGKTGRTSRARVVLAAALLAGAVSAVALSFGTEAEAGIALSITAMVTLLGATLAIGPLLVGPVMRALGAAFAPVLGQPAKLAALNADRNPKRTAASAAALTIGLAVVSLTTTVMAGVEAGQNRGLDEQLNAGFVVSSVSTQPLPPTLADTLAAVPGVKAAAPRTTFSSELGRYGPWQLAAVRGDAVGAILRPHVVAGTLDRLGPGELAVSSHLAKYTGLGVGSTIQAGPVPLRVVAVYDAVSAPGIDLGLGLVDLAQMPAIAYTAQTHDDSILVKAPPSARSALEKALEAAPLAKLTSVGELKAQASERTRSTLNLMWALTALAVLIAFAGIANTLSLSVLERTRESALLRALGLTRGGLGATLATESVFIAMLGASCGLLLGIGSAWLITEVAKSAGEPMLFTLPWGRLGVLLGAAVLAAPLAALLPARRAARGSLTAGMA
ncbi:putative ABC transport system permease protein [Amycolatopsis xylanica]|uniref:Putative ABC transport system permease protein n=1 Tax=Amycolatopsis xylanica TaxID=589385 RepID=A0A1H3K9E8_9PSEU|nr:ABC transporter permease [Amycolatopsis xylanica]SDY48812.1 putative ABC transport system permease protein [Amycolatopsis xylanica]